MLHRTKRSGTVTAMRKTRLLALDAQDFHALIERMPRSPPMSENRQRRGSPIAATSPLPSSRKPRMTTSQRRNSSTRLNMISSEKPLHTFPHQLQSLRRNT